MKAHLTVSAPAQVAWLIMGNEHVDRFAKLGARRHPVDAAAMERLSRSRIVVEHVGKYIGFVMSRVLPRLNEIPRPARVVLPRCLNPTAVVVMPPTGVPHELAWDPSVQRFRCIACWASSHCKLELYRSPCPAPHGFGHIVMRTGRYVFCK